MFSSWIIMICHLYNFCIVINETRACFRREKRPLRFVWMFNFHYFVFKRFSLSVVYTLFNDNNKYRLFIYANWWVTFCVLCGWKWMNHFCFRFYCGSNGTTLSESFQINEKKNQFSQYWDAYSLFIILFNATFSNTHSLVIYRSPISYERIIIIS